MAPDGEGLWTYKNRHQRHQRYIDGGRVASGGAASGPSGSSVTLRATFGAVQAADDGVAAMASQDSDASELELAKEYSDIQRYIDKVSNALCGGASFSIDIEISIDIDTRSQDHPRHPQHYVLF